MSPYLNAQPDLISACGGEVSQIQSALSGASSVSFNQTAQIAAAAGDEVSQAITATFGGYAKEFQSALSMAQAFQSEFARTMTFASSAYPLAESALASMLGLNPASVSAANAAPIQVADMLFMTGSGMATPPQSVINNMTMRFLDPFFQLSSAGHQIAVTTAEGLYPLTGTNDLLLNTSLARGLISLDNAINLAIHPSSTVTPGINNITVQGHSQSSVLISMIMPKLVSEGFSPGQLHFILTGDPSNPNGGLLSRFPDLNLPTLGVTFGSTTPTNDFPTQIWTLEYDGFADFPRYPINPLADLNALAGIIFVHTTYQHLSNAQLSTAFALPQSGNPSMTTFEMIPTPNLPLLDPLRAIPGIGTPLADLIQPDLRYLVNWGYGNLNYGWSTSPADIPTPFGFLPPWQTTGAVLIPDLIQGTQQGIGAFMTDISHIGLPNAAEIGSLFTRASAGAGLFAQTVPNSPTAFANGILNGIQSANDSIIGTLTTDFSAAYSTLLPTADLATALAVNMPSYDLNLFVGGLKEAINGDPVGGLINAVGLPVSADVALVTLAGGFQGFAIENAVKIIATGNPVPGLQ